MKSAIRRLLAVVCVILVVLSTATTAFAHSGRTDSRGGHKDNKNKSGLGSYHYHCGGYPAHLHTNGYCPYRDVFPSSVSMKTDKKTLGIGETITVVAAVNPSNACDTDVSWSSSDTTVATVSNGVVTAKNYGTTTITAETFNGKVGSVKIAVKEITAEKVTVSGLPNSSDFYIGEAFKLTAQITPENVDDPSIVWSSSNSEVATVSSDGSVKLLTEGKVEILATASNGVVGKVSIDVKEKYVESIDIADDQLDILLGDELDLDITILPSDATNPEIIWGIEDTSIVSVSEEGLLKALACGETVVTATSSNGLTDTVVVKVSEIKAESLQIESPTSILLGDTVVLSALFTPSNTTDQNVIWSVDNSAVATISVDGSISAIGLGTVTITAEHKDVSSTHILEILPVNVEEILITTNMEESVSKEDTVQFFAAVLPSNATYPNITWSVSDPEIATIDENGVLTAIKGGTVNVIATSGDGFFAEYEVSISSPAAGVVGVVGMAGAGVVVISAIAKKRKSK